MESLENVYFYGGSFEILGRPELDCGDCITINTLVLDKATDTMVSKVYPNVLICGHNCSLNDGRTCYNLGCL